MIQVNHTDNTCYRLEKCYVLRAGITRYCNLVTVAKEFFLYRSLRWTYFQSRNRDADVKNGYVDAGREGEARTNWESSVNIYTLPRVKWRRKWQPTPVFLPAKSHGQRSLVGYRPRVHKSWTRLSNYTTTTAFTKQIASGKLLYNTGSSARCSVMT